MFLTPPTGAADLDPKITAGTHEMRELYGVNGFIGTVGIIWTSLAGLECFMWYVPAGEPTRGDIREMRRALDRWGRHTKAHLWATIERERKDLVHWARFMGMENCGRYDAVNDMYRRRSWG